MNEIIGKPNYSFGYLKTIYSHYLQPNFKYTFENKYILNELDRNKLAITANAPYQNISFTDLSGNKHTIKDFRGKPLIIMVWATWCVPCIAEMPMLTELYLKFKNRLQLIAFSLDKDEKNHKTFVSKNNMHWINVYGRYDFCKVYGADKGVPQVYVIDKNGTIVYSRSIFKDYELKKLPVVVEQILTL
jgi:thiol-disulfide isomerase/thioredoxin